LLVSLLVWAWGAWKSGSRPTWPQSPFTWATLLFLASYFVSAFVGVDSAESAKSVHKYLILLAIFPVAAMGLQGEKATRLLYVFTVGAAICSLWGISKHFFGFDQATSTSSLLLAFQKAFVHEDRIRSFSGHYMVFGGLLMSAVLLGAHFVKHNPKDRLAWVCLGLNLYGLVLTQTRGAWLGLAVGFLIWGFFTNRKWMVVGLAVMSAGFLLVPTRGRERIFNILRQNDVYQDSSDAQRLRIWRSGIRIVKDHPVFGIGQGNTEKVYPAYKEERAMEPTVGHMHNNFMQMAVQNGLVGLAAFILWLGTYVWIVRRKRPRDPEDARLHFVLSCVFLAAMVWGLTEYTFSHQFMSVQAFFLGIQLGLARNST
jgi:O-antigen ligase